MSKRTDISTDKIEGHTVSDPSEVEQIECLTLMAKQVIELRDKRDPNGSLANHVVVISRATPEDNGATLAASCVASAEHQAFIVKKLMDQLPELVQMELAVDVMRTLTETVEKEAGISLGSLFEPAKGDKILTADSKTIGKA